MSNWAIVIGINKYWRPEACLHGAVRDAVDMCEWLKNPDGGAVPESQLFVALEPDHGTAPAPTVYGADYQTVTDVIRRLVLRSGANGDRLFFYFAGHGLTSRVNYSDESAIALADFTDQHPEYSLSLRSIFEFFQATQFREQFFFIDACRNIPWEGEFRIGYLQPRRRDPEQESIQQFICFATSPGVPAAEIGQAGNERGAFTGALLPGLGGAGTAKAWNGGENKYLVRWADLFCFVETEMRGKRVRLGRNEKPLFQTPRQTGERGGGNPVLASFPDGFFSEESLAVYIDPLGAARYTEVVVSDYGDIEQRARLLDQVPAPFRLPPREYTLKAEATHFVPEKRRWAVSVYSPADVTVTMRPGTPVSTAGSPTATGKLIVQSSDTLAALELADGAGAPIRSGRGRLEVPGLKPGFYRARLVSPEGEVIEQMIDIEPGERKEIALPAPQAPRTELFRQVITRTASDVQPDNTVEVSEAVGPIAAPRMSTLLMLTGEVVNRDTPWGHRLREIGLRSFREAVPNAGDTGVQVLFAVEDSAWTGWSHPPSPTRVAIWHLDEQLGPATMSRPIGIQDVLGLGAYSTAVRPGPHWLMIHLPGTAPTVFAVAALSGRLTLVVVHQDNDGQIRVLQYLPALTADTAPHGRAPRSEPMNVRRLELMQRFYLSGRLDLAYPNARELLNAKWIEPIAGALGGYLMLRLGKVGELRRASANMSEFFGELSDSHILMAVYADLEREDRDLAAREFRRALDHGVPIFADGLGLLLDGIERHGIEHPRVPVVRSLFNRHLPGLIWSAVQSDRPYSGLAPEQAPFDGL
jgi:Caspase domain